jgi:hypothetical protein
MTACAGINFRVWPCGPHHAEAATVEILGGFRYRSSVVQSNSFRAMIRWYHKDKGDRSIAKVSINAILLCLLHGIGKRLRVCTRTMEYIKIV